MNQLHLQNSGFWSGALDYDILFNNLSSLWVFAYLRDCTLMQATYLERSLRL
jgi:hypothetical protein